MRTTKKAKVEGYDKLERECSVWRSVATQLLNGDKPDAVEKYATEDGDKYRHYLYGAKRADGGLLVTLFDYVGQRTQVDAQLFEDWIKHVDGLPHGHGYLNLKIAAERLQNARRAIFDAEIRAAHGE